MAEADQPLIAHRYRLADKLGGGGMGRVWRARDELLHRDVAVKEMLNLPEWGDGEQDSLVTRTLREARVAGRLRHPNVVSVFDVVQEDGRPWIIMELVPSRSLTQVINKDGPLEPRRVAEIGLELLGALTAAHKAGVMHRDVKPGNVLLGEDDRVVLTDFGIAVLEGDPSITRAGLVLGSPAYTAPERARGEPAQPASDLWALGATLYTAVEGKPAFDRGAPMPTLTAVALEPPRPADRAGPLEPLLTDLLAKEPADRPNAIETGRRLRQVIRELDHPMPEQTLAFEPKKANGVAVKTATTRILPAQKATKATKAPAKATGDAANQEPAATPRKAAGKTYGRVPAVLRGAGRHSLLITLVLIAALLLGLSAVAWAANNKDDEPERAATKPSASASDRPSDKATAKKPSAAASKEPPTANPIPAGWATYQDATGFSIAKPKFWTVRKNGRFTYLEDPTSASYLLVDQTSSPRPDAATDWAAQERVRGPQLADYRSLGIRRVTYFSNAADWEFTYTKSGVGPVHVVNRGVVTTPGRQAYGLYFLTAARSWDASQPVWQAFTRTFKPRTVG